MNAPTPMDRQQPVKKRALTPRDAATLIVVDRSSDAQAEREPRILMGHRSGKHVFMPNTFVFPGGRLDPEDVGILHVKPTRLRIDCVVLPAQSTPPPPAHTTTGCRTLALPAHGSPYSRPSLR